MRKILGRYVIGEVIVPFLIIFEKLIKRLRLFLFNYKMDIYYHYKDRRKTGIGPVYLNGRPQTRQEQREALEEDGRMTPAEIEEWLDSLEM
jgi:hypothetical protein